MYQGSCLCKVVRYQIDCVPEVVGNCHCRMCQKQHGAAFATYVSIKRKHLHYLAGEEKLARYQSSEHASRRFCSCCGSNIEWSSQARHANWVSIPLATFDTPFTPSHIKNYYTESTCEWNKHLGLS